MGASESLKSRFSHHLGSVFPIFSLQLRVLRDRYEFEYWLDHLCHVTLVCSFHSMSLVCFLLRAFVFSLLARHILSLCCHLLYALGYVHWSSFYTVHLSRARYPILCLILDSIFDSTLIFSLRKGERHVFTFTFFSRESPWSPYHFFSYGARVESWVKDMWL